MLQSQFYVVTKSHEPPGRVQGLGMLVQGLELFETKEKMWQGPGCQFCARANPVDDGKHLHNKPLLFQAILAIV